MKLNEEEKKIFEDFLSFLQLHPELKKWELSSEPVLSLPDLEIDPSQRLVRCNQKEVGLTAKEYSLLCLLTVNNGRVLTYSQIYEKVWGEALTINERGTIGYHVRNLRKKLYSADPHHPFYYRKCPRGWVSLSNNFLNIHRAQSEWLRFSFSQGEAIREDFSNFTPCRLCLTTFGWIEEWIGRGMQESAKTMAALLATNGMK